MEKTGGISRRNPPSMTGSHPGRRTFSGPKKNVTEGPTAVIFVERTKGGGLAKDLRRAEESLQPVTGREVKIVEKCGDSLKSLLWTPDPFGGHMCTLLNCGICSQGGEEGGKKKICQSSNVIYKSSCRNCKEEGGTVSIMGRLAVLWGREAMST